MNHELLDVQARFRKGRETRDQIASICCIIKKAREFQRNFRFIDYTKAFDCVQFSSVTQSCLTLCNPMDCSTPGFLVHDQHPEPTQTHVHRVGDAIQPSHPLSSPSPAFNLSQRQEGLFPMSQLFTSGGQSIGVSASTSVLPMNSQD